VRIDLTGVESATWADAPSKQIFPGVVRRDLWSSSSGAKALILEFAPGAKFLALDEHYPGPEEVFVLSGVFNDGVHDYPAGTFIHSPTGSAHVPQSKEGCVLFVFFPQG
jgi:anti-sigma factor ChrR (cupin superfamily)